MDSIELISFLAGQINCSTNVCLVIGLVMIETQTFLVSTIQDYTNDDLNKLYKITITDHNSNFI